MAAETNIIASTDLAPAQSIDYIAQFTFGQRKLLEVLGVTHIQKLTAGTTLKTYKSTVTLADGKVAEGDVIPLSKVERKLAATYDLAIRKRRKSVPLETIQTVGYDLAVAETDNQLRSALQREVRRDFFATLKAEAQATTATNLQGAFSKALLNVFTVFEDVNEDVKPVIFVNPIDATDYLAAKEITVQNAFGLNYVQDFMGVATLILNTDVPAGHVYTTASSNIVAATAVLGGGEIGKAFNLSLDETGLIGIAHFEDMTTLTTQTVTVSYFTLFAEIADGVVDITIAPVA